MAFAWSINPYKGCVHGCHYCFARRYHSFIDLDVGDDFTGIILVRVNAPEVLRRELAKRSWKREMVALGTATDPYQPIEGKYRLTRGILEALRDFRTPVSIITKGSMVVRDIDVLADLQQRAGCTVSFSTTTLDEDTWRRLEPGTPPPLQRLRAMQRLAEAGVNAGVNLTPVVPGLTDNLDNLQAVVRAASEHRASFVNAMPLRLQTGVKEHFLGFLDREYPHLLPRYQSLYAGQYPSRRYDSWVQHSVGFYRERFGV
jgi:DNA repair photolyase